MDTVNRWLTDGRDWLDARGSKAWLIAMIVGFVFFWPVGLAFLFYMLGTNRMMGYSCKNRRTHRSRGTMRTSGNSAFDAYREETLKRLEEESGAFNSFLQRLRDAKDKAEFDEFMSERNSDKGAEPA